MGDDVAMIEFLISRGADLTATDNNGQTPADLAVSKRAIKLLRQERTHSSPVGAPRKSSPDPETKGDIYLLTAISVYNQRDYSRALKLFRLIEEEHPEDAEVKFHIARCHVRLGDRQAATAALAQAAELDPRYISHDLDSIVG